ncbi:hypothetical protein [Mesorhizobium sp. WSM2239]|uniref:Hedgehog/Intein (Hint) domain-containing protein n=2 Tax=unclassified Mesorhizobium TaxID=325217 RepID=A0AAU8DIK2_9HYPH
MNGRTIAGQRFVNAPVESAVVTLSRSQRRDKDGPLAGRPCASGGRLVRILDGKVLSQHRLRAAIMGGSRRATLRRLARARLRGDYGLLNMIRDRRLAGENFPPIPASLTPMTSKGDYRRWPRRLFWPCKSHAFHHGAGNRVVDICIANGTFLELNERPAAEVVVPAIPLIVNSLEHRPTCWTDFSGQSQIPPCRRPPAA